MLRILRSIRSKSIKNNKLAQFSLYAIGEVTLVIIGILIAVSLNNSNEARKERAEINKILARVQSDLTNNIYVIGDHYIKYSGKDTVVNNFLDSLNIEQSPNKQDAYLAWQALMRYNSFELQNEGYKALMLKAEYIPDEYSNIVSNLNYLYTQLHGLIDEELETANKKIEDYRVAAGESANWYMDLTYRGQGSDEFLDFLVNDLSFRNMLVTDFYGSGVLDSRSNKFYEYALKTYRKIDEVLSKYDLQSKNKPFFDYEISDYHHLIGDYSNTTTLDTFSLVEYEEILYLTRKADTTRFEIYPLSKKNLAMESTVAYFDVEYENDSLTKGIRFHRGSVNYYYERTAEQ